MGPLCLLIPPGPSPSPTSDLAFLCSSAFLLCVLVLFIWVDEAHFPLYRWQQGPLISGTEHIMRCYCSSEEGGSWGCGEEKEKEEKGEKKDRGGEMGRESAQTEKEPHAALAFPGSPWSWFQTMFGTLSASLPHGLLFA